MRLYLDTSALNKLAQDPDWKEGDVHAFASSEHVWVSTLNIAEVGATPDPVLRLKLGGLLHDLARGYRPLTFPSQLLKRSLSAYVDCPYRSSILILPLGLPEEPRRSMNWQVKEDLAGFQAVLADPKLLLDHRQHRELDCFLKKERDWYEEFAAGDRPRFQAVREAKGDPYRNGWRLIKYLHSREDLLDEYFDEIFERLGYGRALNGTASRILENLEPWRMFFSALAHGIYGRSIKTRGHSYKKHPGGMDTKQSIYLACSDAFVTADRGQLRLLRVISRLGFKKRHVMDYSVFRNMMLPTNRCRR